MNTTIEAIKPSSLLKLLNDTITDIVPSFEKNETFSPVLSYISNLISYQCSTDNFHSVEWEKTCASYLKIFLTEAQAGDITKSEFEAAKRDLLNN